MAESEDPPPGESPEPVLDVIAMANGFVDESSVADEHPATAVESTSTEVGAEGSSEATPSALAEPAQVGPKPIEVAARSQFRKRRTWPQRLLLVLNIIVILACFAGATALVLGRRVGNSLAKVDIESPTVTTPAPTNSDLASVGGTLPVGVTTILNTVPPETFPPADPTAKNFLITGADNNACIDPDSPYAAAFGDRQSMGERSDTVMIMRVDPSTNRSAILSFPRDLWVKIAGRNSSQRINAAYVKDDPQRLIDTIYENFGVGVDHFIQIDFCAFKTIVDSIDGGVGVPFLFPARDTHTGLFVPVPGCFNFTGDSALAYVRSRHYQYYNDKGKWKEDPVSDLGRVSRQQDFLRRVLTSALNQGLVSPSLARGLIDAAQQNVVVDSGLTLSKMLEFVGVLRGIQPGGIQTYQIEASGKTIQGNAVLVPNLKSENMQAILRIFRGESPLAAAPEQVFETTTTTMLPTAPATSAAPASTVRPTSTSRPAGTGASSTSTSAATSTTTTTIAATVPPALTEPGPAEIIKGIVPPRDVSCP